MLFCGDTSKESRFVFDDGRDGLFQYDNQTVFLIEAIASFTGESGSCHKMQARKEQAESAANASSMSVCLVMKKWPERLPIRIHDYSHHNHLRRYPSPIVTALTAIQDPVNSTTVSYLPTP